MKTPLPPNEEARMEALNAYAILDSPAETPFDDLVQLAARLCEAPMAAVSLVDSDRQWFKARLGLKDSETDRANSFCAHGIVQETDLLVVPDARQDARFAHFPLVLEDPHVQFYGGARLSDPQGHALGMLCVMDRVPRELTDLQKEALRTLARQVMAQLKLRQELIQRQRLEGQLRRTHDELELRVRQRIAALEALNQSLKRAEHESSEWKNRYELIVASSGLAIYDVDRLTGEVFWGSGAEQVLGLEPTALNYASGEWLDLVHPRDRSAVKRGMEGALVNGQSFDVQYRLCHGLDHYRWIQDRGFVIPDAQGRCARVLGMVQDITQRKLAEETMREQAALLDQTQDAIMVRDLENRILYWNHTAEKLYGWTLGEVMGKTVQEVLLRGELGLLPVAHAATLDQGEWSGEVKVLTKAKKELTIHSRWNLLRDSDGKPYAFLVAHTDLTERKLLEAKFLRAQRLESLGALASGIAHDLNNVFTPILMCVDLIGESVANPSQTNLVGILRASARRGSEMVKQVLSFARGEGADLGQVQLKHLLNDLQKMMRDTFPRNIKVETNLAGDLALVPGDATQLYQVMMNLCVNARDAMPGGGTLRIEASNLQLDRPPKGATDAGRAGLHVCVTVADTGTGMTPEVQKKIFEPFFTTKEVGKGTGLGLSTVMTLVKAHGGTVELESEVGVGTRFKILFPAELASVSEPATTAKEAPSGNGELLLVVEDESAIREILKATLEAHSYDVLLAEEGTEALAIYAVQREKIALVITDMSMPVLDGRGTIRALRKMNPNVKVIAVSGLLEPSKLAQMADGGTTVLSKPYSSDKLLTTIHQVLHPAQD